MTAGGASEEPAEGEPRLQKVLAAAGVGSRRACEDLIRQGRVTVDGKVAELGSRVDAATAEVRVDGERVVVDPRLVYVMLNKPRGVLTTAADPQGRPTAVELVHLQQRVFPVGRLDLDTEGLLLLTNDGALSHALTHPSFEVPRVYLAQVRGRARREQLRSLTQGVELDDGVAAARKATVLGDAGDRTLIELTLTEGRKHEVRRMLLAVGLPVERLARTSYGGVELGDLRQGRWRPLTNAEVATLFRAVERGPKPRRAPKVARSNSSVGRRGDEATSRSVDKRGSGARKRARPGGAPRRERAG